MTGGLGDRLVPPNSHLAFKESDTKPIGISQKDFPHLPLTSSPLAVHADWSVRATKRWMTIAAPEGAGWRIDTPEPVGPPETLFARLRARAGTAPIAFGIDCPLGVPRAYAAQALDARDFPTFLRGLAAKPDFFAVAPTLPDVSLSTPFYPLRGRAGMTRLAHAQALGLADAAALNRACDRATADRPAGAPVFWTLGANQSGKAALAAWRDLLIPALAREDPVWLWPFDGAFLTLLGRGGITVAETYPAEAMRHLGLRPAGSKRRQSDRAAYAAALRARMDVMACACSDALGAALTDGFGAGEDGEDRFDSLLGVLCVVGVVQGRRTDAAPDDEWIQRWEGWVLGQAG